MKCWVYHKSEAPKIVDEAEAKRLYKEGWSDTPATFLDLSNQIDMTDDFQVQVTGEVMDEMKDRANDLLKAKSVRRKGFQALAEKYGADPELDTPDLRAAVLTAIGDDDDDSNGGGV